MPGANDNATGVAAALAGLLITWGRLDAAHTPDAFGVDGREAWRRVHEANMAKVAGINANRPNRFGLPDLTKPDGWVAPSHVDLCGELNSLFQRGGAR